MDNQTILDGIASYGAIMYQYALVNERLADLKKSQRVPGSEYQVHQAVKEQARKVASMTQDYRAQNPAAAELVTKPLSILEKRCLELSLPEILKTSADTLHEKVK